MNEHARREGQAQRQLHIDAASSKLAAISSELAIYEAIITARTPLPAPTEISFLPITFKERHVLLARALIYEQFSTINYVVFLRVLEQRQKRIMAAKQLVSARIDMRFIQNVVSRARKELDAADCAKAAAWSTTLPQAMGEGRVAQGLGMRFA